MTLRDIRANGVRRAGSPGVNGNGVVIDTASGGRAVAHIVNSAIADSGLDPNGTGIAVHSTGANANARVSRTEIQANRWGFLAQNGGQILSAGDNDVWGNINDGAATGTLTRK